MSPESSGRITADDARTDSADEPVSSIQRCRIGYSLPHALSRAPPRIRGQLCDLRNGCKPHPLAICLSLASAASGASANEISNARGASSTPGPISSPPGQDKERSGPLNANEKARFNRVLETITPLGDVTQHQDELEELGLYIVSEAPSEGASARSSVESDMIIPRPQVLWDSSNQRYYAYASYRWVAANTQDHYYDIGALSPSCVDASCTIGGMDGFGMRFSRKVTNVEVNAIFCGRGDLDRDYASFACSTPTNPDANSQEGVSWRKQDRVYKTVIKPDNNMFQGSTAMVIKRPACGPALQIFSRYGHSWDETSLDGFSVGLKSFTLNFSKTSARWAASSQSGTWDVWDPC